jgi:hypothetical protein
MPYTISHNSPSPPDTQHGQTQVQGITAAKKESAKTEEINKDRFHNLVKASNSTLYKLASVFPFDFFTDEISIEITQINVIKRLFFATAHLQTIPIKNVADVFVQTSILFASLRIIDSSYIENSIQVDNLKKSDAVIARRIIQGLVIANKEGIDLAKIPRSTLFSDIENLGMAQEVDIVK